MSPFVLQYSNVGVRRFGAGCWCFLTGIDRRPLLPIHRFQRRVPAGFKFTEKRITCHGIIKAAAIRVDPGARVAVRVAAEVEAVAVATPGARAAVVRHLPIWIRPYVRDAMPCAESCPAAARDRENH